MKKHTRAKDGQKLVDERFRKTGKRPGVISLSDQENIVPPKLKM
jgi:hypothetical protein